jgi:hypothetical protein
MPVRRRLAFYGTSVAAVGMVPFILVLSGLGAGGIRDEQDRTLTTMADAAAATLTRGDVTLTAYRPLLLVDLSVGTEPFLLVPAADGLSPFGT